MKNKIGIKIKGGTGQVAWCENEKSRKNLKEHFESIGYKVELINKKYE